MKALKPLFVALVIALGLSSCQSVRVATDYDRTVNFDQYKTFAFYKPGIDKAKISDLDKRRILRAIDSSLTAKGMTLSKDPDLLVSIGTQTTKNINVYPNYYGWYSPWYYGRYNSVYSTIEGSLTINLIDASKNILVWQGVGTGFIRAQSVADKVANIYAIVKQILDRYPPGNGAEKE